MNSDHRLLMADLGIRVERLLMKKKTTINAETLREQSKKQEYVEKISESNEQLIRA